MAEATSDGRQQVRDKAGVASLKLVQHRSAPVVQNTRTAGDTHCEQHQDARLEGLPPHQPTAADCYGCVDWFQF